MCDIPTTNESKEMPNDVKDFINGLSVNSDSISVEQAFKVISDNYAELRDETVRLRELLKVISKGILELFTEEELNTHLIGRRKQRRILEEAMNEYYAELAREQAGNVSTYIDGGCDKARKPRTPSCKIEESVLTTLEALGSASVQEICKYTGYQKPSILRALKVVGRRLRSGKYEARKGR